MSAIRNAMWCERRRISSTSIEQTQQAQTAQWMDGCRTPRRRTPTLMASLNPDTPMSLPMQHLAMDSPVGIEILQWLSANPDESQRFSTLHPAETYREMGKLEARLEAALCRGPARVVFKRESPDQAARDFASPDR
jgi:hypothetical protein